MPEPHAEQDEILRALSPRARRALRGIARGGWTGSPGLAACEEMQAATGVGWQSEAIRGEPRAYYAASRAAHRLAEQWVERLDALPRGARR